MQTAYLNFIKKQLKTGKSLNEINKDFADAIQIVKNETKQAHQLSTIERILNLYTEYLTLKDITITS